MNKKADVAKRPSKRAFRRAEEEELRLGETQLFLLSAHEGRELTEAALARLVGDGLVHPRAPGTRGACQTPLGRAAIAGEVDA